MRRVLFLVPAIMLFLCLPATAATNSAYLALKGVVSSANNESTPKDSGGRLKSVEKHSTRAGFALAVGGVFAWPGVQFRLELENTMRFAPVKIKNTHYDLDTEISLHSSTLANIHLDFPLNDLLVPYIGAGIGLGLVRYDSEARSATTKYKESGTSIALEYVMTSGVELKLGKNLSLDFSVRYLGGNDYEIKYGNSGLKERISIVNAEFGTGFRYTF